MSTPSRASRQFASRALQLAWDLVRLPLLVGLSLLAPLVLRICGTLFFFGIVVSIAFKISAAGPTFPFWHMIAASFGFAFFVVLYYAVIAALWGRHRPLPLRTRRSGERWTRRSHGAS